MWRILEFSLQAITILLLLVVLREQRHLAKKGEKAMGDQFDALGAAVEAVATAEADMEQRIDALIDALRMPNDDPRVGAMIAKLEATRTRLREFSGQVEEPPTETPPDEPTEPPVEPSPDSIDTTES